MAVAVGPAVATAFLSIRISTEKSAYRQRPPNEVSGFLEK